MMSELRKLPMIIIFAAWAVIMGRPFLLSGQVMTADDFKWLFILSIPFLILFLLAFLGYKVSKEKKDPTGKTKPLTWLKIAILGWVVWRLLNSALLLLTHAQR